MNARGRGDGPTSWESIAQFPRGQFDARDMHAMSEKPIDPATLNAIAVICKLAEIPEERMRMYSRQICSIIFEYEKPLDIIVNHKRPTQSAIVARLDKLIKKTSELEQSLVSFKGSSTEYPITEGAPNPYGTWLRDGQVGHMAAAERTPPLTAAKTDKGPFGGFVSYRFGRIWPERGDTGRPRLCEGQLVVC